MDIKTTKASLSQEVNSAFGAQGGSTESPSIMAQFVIRTMSGDLKNAAAQPTPAPATKPTPASPTLTPAYLKTVTPPVAAPRPNEQKEFRAAIAPIKPIEEIKALFPEPTAQEPTSKTAEAKAVEEKIKKEEIKLKTEETKAAILASKETARQEEKNQEKELRDLFESAKLKLAAKEFNAAIADAQKIADNSEADWMMKWQAKRLITQAQKDLTEKKAAPASNFNSPGPKAITSSAPLNLPVVEEAPAAKKENLPTPPQTAKLKTEESKAPAAPASFQMANSLIPGLDLMGEKNAPAGNEPAEVLDIKKIAIVGLAFVAVLALIISGLYFIFKKPPAVQTSPTPTATLAPATPTPSLAPSALFKTDSQKIFELKAGQEKANLQEILMQLAKTEEPAESLIQLLFKNSQGNYLSLTEVASLAEIDLFDLPTQAATGPLRSQLSMASSSFFIYSQPSASSSPFVAQTNSGRLGLIIALKEPATTSATSSEETAKSLKDLEQLILPSLKILLPNEVRNNLPDKSVWQNNAYKNVAIRYVNLPEPSLSFDYAILNDKLIFATSKESMYAIIDRLLND